MNFDPTLLETYRTLLQTTDVQKAYQELERSGVIYSVAGKGSFVSPGPAAARMLRGQRLEKLREAAAEGRRAGIPREEALGAVKAVYEEGTNHD